MDVTRAGRVGTLVVGCALWACAGVGSNGDAGDGGVEADGSTDSGRDDGSVEPDADGGTEAGLDAGSDGSGDAAPTEEICDDGLDNDRDGEIDESCPCVPGDVATCFTGLASQRNQGICQDGTMTCAGGASTEFGSWGPCEGDVPPADEVCDSEGVDENCSGAANEGCECSPGDPPVPCGSDVGACVPGEQECVDGALGPCEGAVGPTAEICNGIDDDCDGAADEEVPSLPCGTDEGACRPGMYVCAEGAYTTDCIGAITPVDETCNGIDDDCDGSVDEDVTSSCGSDVGACAFGTMTCTDGAWGSCSGGSGPAAESCNAVDDDCDGSVDEGLTRPCGTDVGLCVSGTETCFAGEWGGCSGGVGPTAEVCEGSTDENCDGTVDEGCACTHGETRPCGTDEGECTAGTQTCVSGAWLACSGGDGPSAEVCDGLDNDCDGSADEGLSCGNEPPIVACPGSITSGVLSTVTLSASASDPDLDPLTYSWTVTSRPAGSTSEPSTPSSTATTFFLDAAGDYTVEFCATDDDDASACCTVSITATAPGDLHVELSWSTSYGDVDLHLLRPGATEDRWFTVDDCFFANPTPDWGPVGAAANPILDRDDTDGYGPENITISVTPLSGTYVIGVEHYCVHSMGEGGVDPGSGPTTATVRVYCGGTLVDTLADLALDGTGRFLVVGEVDWPSCTVRDRATTTWITEVVDPALFGLESLLHCLTPCETPGSTSECLPNERCYDTERNPHRTEAYCFFDL